MSLYKPVIFRRNITAYNSFPYENVQTEVFDVSLCLILYVTSSLRNGNLPSDQFKVTIGAYQLYEHFATLCERFPVL